MFLVLNLFYFNVYNCFVH